MMEVEVDAQSQLQHLTKILEEMEDEEQAFLLLRELTAKSRHYKELMLNQEEKLDHDNWKKQCDEVAQQLQTVVEKIQKLQI